MCWIERFPVVLGFVCCAVLIGCGTSETPNKSPRFEPKPLLAEGLKNVFQLSDQLYSGSAPEGPQAFESLKNLGVKTIISVDGARPEVEQAEKVGIRYVHIPVGYDGIPQEKAWAMVRAVQQFPGPVYVHCHHGKHRGPAAAVCVMLAQDPKFTAQDAEAWLKLAGTDPHYQGLYKLPASFVRPSQQDLDSLHYEFRSVAEIPSMTRLMVEMDIRFDHLKALKSAGWKRSTQHADLDPKHEALMLKEHFREAARQPDAKSKGLEFLAMLREAEQTVSQLEEVLRKEPISSEEANAAFQRNQSLCSRCHVKFRD